LLTGRQWDGVFEMLICQRGEKQEKCTGLKTGHYEDRKALGGKIKANEKSPPQKAATTNATTNPVR
jgi:hypothetical protein